MADVPEDVQRWTAKRRAARCTTRSTAAPRADEIELAVWYWRVSPHAKPLLAELSFKANVSDPDEALEADALANRLLRVLGPGWLAEAGAKTEAAYECE